MNGDKMSRTRSLLLARWRRAPRVASEQDKGTVSPPVPKPLSPSEWDEASLFRQFEAEIRGAVAQPTADALCRILAAPRAAVLNERTPKSRAEILAKLDLVEDVLDAVLLAGRVPSEDVENGRAPP